jgi:hypothetical protein
VDYTAAANRLWYCKIYVADAFDVNTTYGVEVSIGSADQSNYHEYNIAGSGANLTVYSTYPAQGGYIITCIDPTIDTWAEVIDSGGTTDQTALLWYGLGAQFQNGNAKSENVAMDAIDYGTGLTLLNGTGADPEGSYVSYVTADQDDIDKRWGAAIGSGNAVTLRGVMTAGSSGTATEFLDETSVVTFPDGYHSRGLFGVNMNIENASSILADGALLIGEGTRNGADANDTRPDYTVTGTAGSFEFYGTMRNFRDVIFTAGNDVHNADIEAHLLTQNSADIYTSIIRTNQLTQVATLQDPTFGTTTDLYDTAFVQSGVGHAIEIDTPGTYDFNDLVFSGYGGTPGTNLTPTSGANDAAIFNSSGGLVTINVVGGNEPSVRNNAVSTTQVNSNVNVTFTVQDTATDPIEDAVVAVYNSTTDAVLSNELTDVNGESSFSVGADTPFYARIRLSTVGGTRYFPVETIGDSGPLGAALTITLIENGIAS